MGGWHVGTNENFLLIMMIHFQHLWPNVKRSLDSLPFRHAILIAGGAIIGQDSFRNVGQYMAVTHLKPDKVLFGIAAGKEKVRTCTYTSLAS